MDGEWYSMLTQGTKLRMGVIRFHNKALTSQMVLALDDILEGEWLRSTSSERRESIEELMSFILISFGTGLQGEGRYLCFC